ncbi:pyrin-like [Malaclemys terrapin pileata]|uniref:pyrin-like n=1 Tax=Malaclemys terrapin pileata TaxID=2991368 RepID=UPI0023A8011A|nr:pyrin-like [Malaclemys terrapin pileata]XP_053883619.1 pyrin-like [Malaclemys terrapin pileata]XP_053883620.1 pyrin-like [Malaclemys terrapin pileata]
MKGEGGKSLFHFLLGTLCSLPVASGQRASLEKTPRDHLIDTISELGESDLKMFKDKLNNFKPKEGYNHIKWSQLEKAEAVEITRLLVSYYDDDYAVEVAGKVLDAMDKKNLAHKLSEAAGKAVTPTQQQSASQAGGTRRWWWGPCFSLQRQRGDRPAMAPHTQQQQTRKGALASSSPPGKKGASASRTATAD